MVGGSDFQIAIRQVAGRSCINYFIFGNAKILVLRSFMTFPTLLKFNIRYYRRHSLLSLLCLMGIALGVGIVVAVDLINSSALGSFSSYVDLLSGRATHSIISGHTHIDEKIFSRIWRHPQIKSASPVMT